MSWIVHDLDIKDGCQAAEALRPNTQRVHLVKDFKSQLFQPVGWTTA